MISTILPIALVALHGGANLRAKAIAYQSEPTLVSMLGPKIVLHHVPGTYFDRRGFDKVWVNAAGAGMNVIVLRPRALYDWKATARMVGIDVSHARVHALGDPNSPIPLTRGSVEITGAGGLPLNSTSHRPWKLEYRESAVADKAKLRSMRGQIRGASGEARNALIRSCYNWYSEIDLHA